MNRVNPSKLQFGPLANEGDYVVYYGATNRRRRLLMKRLILVFVLAFGFAIIPLAAPAQSQDLQRWEQQARNVTIVRDDWGIAHSSGKTDADAVFGMIYAQ